MYSGTLGGRGLPPILSCASIYCRVFVDVSNRCQSCRSSHKHFRCTMNSTNTTSSPRSSRFAPFEGDAAQQTNNPTKISFGVKKREQLLRGDFNLLRQGSWPGDEELSSDVDVEAVKKPLTHFEDGAFPPDKEDSKKSADGLVIPLVKGNDWRIERLLRLKSEGKLSEEDCAKLELLTAAVSPSVISVAEVSGRSVAADASSAITAEDADYEQVPVESFGLAVLRGCGWKEGEGIGMTNKRVVPLKLPQRRPKGLGLGADINMGKPNGKKVNSDDGENSDVRPLKKSSYVKITGGAYRDSYGKVQSFDEDNASVIVELAIGGNFVRVSEYAVMVVSTKEYERDAKCINKRDYDRERRRIERQNEEKERHEGIEERSKSSGKEKETQNRVSRRKESKRKCETKREKEKDTVDARMWVQPELRVRFIDSNFMHGRLYNEKFRVLDASDRENCTVEHSTGKIYYEIREEWLETVIPKEEGACLMILRGPLRGQLGVMERRDKRGEQVLLRVITNDALIKLSFDDVCEWLGRRDDD
uniref:G-patch domain-containing protein n=1 Tax=Parascaris univalens TaxID=6257 RepID=A0A915B925_PARUN